MSDKPRGRWLDDRVAQTRQELVERARDLFGERGYAATPLEDVVRRAGLTRGALYHHFADKQALFEAVVDRVLRDVVDRVEFRSLKRGARQGGEREADVLELFLQELADPPVQRILCVDGPAALGRHRWNELLGARLLEPVRRALDRAVADGALERDLAAGLAPLLFGALQEAALLASRRPRAPGPDKREVERALGWLLERVLGADAAARGGRGRGARQGRKRARSAAGGTGQASSRPKSRYRRAAKTQ